MKTCERCPDLAPKVILGKGPSNPKLIIIGDPPGHDEYTANEPFVGLSGRFLNGALKRIGIRRDEVYLTSVIKCRPPGNRKPTLPEMGNCLDEYLINELAQLSCKTIVTVGELATKIVCGKCDAIGKIRGTPLKSQLSAHNVIPTVHPSFIIRGNMEYFGIFVGDILKAWRVENEELDLNVERRYIYDPHSAEATDYINRCLETGYSADIESTGLDPHRSEVLGIAICNEPHTGLFFKLPENEIEVKRILAHPCAKIFQFGQFDTYFLETKGYEVNGWEFDTKYAQKLIAPELPSSLSFLSSVYTPYPYYKGYAGKEIRKTVTSVPQQVLAEYCITDADATEIVAIELKKELEEYGMTDLMRRTVMPLAHLVVKMRKRGIRIDLEALEQERVNIGPEVASRKKWFEDKGVNPNSPKQLGNFLKNTHNLPLPKTKTGYTTDSETLTKLHRKYDLPILQQVLDYRDKAKQLSTYIKPIAEKQFNGRIHTELVVGGTTTGRLSSRDPNMQNIPPNLRHVFLPEPNHLIVDADYKQLELHVLAVLSADAALMQDLNSGVYIPIEIGKSMGWDDERAKAHKRILKAVMYGTLYGRGARAIAIEFGITTKEAEAIQRAFLQRFTAVNRYLEGERKQATEQGNITTPFGRRRHFVGSRVATQAYNFKIQSCAADIMSNALIEIEHNIPGGLILSVHDSAVLTIHKEKIDETMPLLKAILERPVAEMRNFSFPATIEVGENWRDVEEYDGV